MILVISNEEDLTTDYVTRELGAASVPFVRLNIERLPRDGALTFAVEPSEAGSYLEYLGQTYDLEKVRAVYYRRPGVPDLHSLVPTSVAAYARSEYEALVQTLYRTLRVRWINHPFAVHAAESKAFQLTLARRLGFHVPRTLVTNSPEKARAFVSSTGRVIAKTIKSPRLMVGNQPHIVFTTLLSPEDHGRLGDLVAAPCILQEFIEKTIDVRVVVVGTKVFAAAIHSQGTPSTRVDWRAGVAIDLPHEAIQPPDAIEAMCVAMCRELELEFGAIDFAVRADGSWIFFEINPNGQWAWLEEQPGLPIVGALVRRLREAVK